MSRKIKTIRIGIAQINTTVGALKGNRDKIISNIKKAKKAGVSIVTFPELAITGYPPEDLLFKPEFIDKNRAALNEVADAAEDIIVICGFVERVGSLLYNSAAVIADRSVKGVYHKLLLPNYGVFDEKRYFRKGIGNPIFSCDGILFSVSICEDIWFRDGPCKVQSEKGKAAILFNISSSPYHMKKIVEREGMLKERARECSSFIAYNNLVGGQDELVFDGGSMLLSPKGDIIARGKQFEEDLIIADIFHDELKAEPNSKAGNDILYIPVDCAFTKNTASELRKKYVCPTLSKIEEVYSALVTGTKDYVLKNRFSKAVIGVSGGIDSALTTAIAVDALSCENVIAVSMPSPYSSRGSVEDAEELAKNLCINMIKLPIHSVFNAYNETLSRIFTGTESGITEENIQARVRGTLLMALSNKFGWILLTTGNKSEISVGYCTLYGDMAGGFAVLKDVPKTLVYELSYYRNSISKNNCIPLSTLKKPPSAELRPDQKDSDSLPPYSMLDQLLSLFIEGRYTPAEIVSKGFEKGLVQDISVMLEKSEYKRRQGPPGVKITPVAFGKDWRFPVTNHFSLEEGKG